MKINRIFTIVLFAAIALGACSGNKNEKTGSDSAAVATGDSSKADTSVKPADSTHSFRNDRGTDSVSAGKSIPAKP